MDNCIVYWLYFIDVVDYFKDYIKKFATDFILLNCSET